MWFIIRGLAVGGSIKLIQSISNNFFEASRFRTFNVDNDHQMFKYWIAAAPGTASLLGALNRGWLYFQYTQVDAQAIFQSCGFGASSGFGWLPKLISGTEFKGKMVVELSVLGSKANQESTTLWCQELLWHWSCGSNKHNPPWPYWEIFCLTPCTSELSITQTCGLRYPTCILRYHQRGLRNHKRSTRVVFQPMPPSTQLVFSS